MRQLATDHVTELVADHNPPCISLYMPTHRRFPENQQDPIRYGNLLREMENSLHEKYPAQDTQTLLEQLEALTRDNRFWNQRTDGLAILTSSDSFHIFDLQHTVEELLVVADSFHTKPLIQALQAADRYQVLALNRHEAKLYEGNRHALDPVELTNVPSTITDALGDELTEPHQTVASYGDVSGAPRSPHGEPRMFHGHGGKKDEVEIDLVRFFRAVDRGILEHHSRPSGLPLMLAALPEYHAPFREVSHNAFLMAGGIEVHPDALNLDELRVLAWKNFEPLYIERLNKLVEDYQLAASRELGSDDLPDVAQAAVAGRVSTLLLETDRRIHGAIDAKTGKIEPGDLSHPEIDDVLDDLAEVVLRMNGEVVLLDPERMPSSTGLAATYRY